MNLDHTAIVEFERIITAEAQALLEFTKTLHHPSNESSSIQKTLLEALKIFEKCLKSNGKIVLLGVGKSGKIAAKISATLCSTGSSSIFLHPSDAIHGDMGIIGANDVIFALSQSGNTDELLRLILPLRNLRLPIVGLGGNRHSRLAEQCDLWIQAHVLKEACPHNLAPTCSTTLALAIGDAFALTLMQLRGDDQGSFVKNHPGGRLGARLNLKIKEIMHQGPAVGTVEENTSIQDLVSSLTQSRLGAVLVVEGKKLKGIVTDGDLRRAMGEADKFFALKAKNIMTDQPVTIGPEELAQTALELFENRPFQIKELPVVDTDKNWLGLVRIHDLLQAL